MKIVELFEAGRVFSVGTPKSKVGAPADKARAFDKVHGGTGKRPNRSLLKKLEKENRQDKYYALEFSDEGEHIMCLVMKADVAMNQSYYGVNVLFYPDGKIDAATSDALGAKQWTKDKGEIVKVAKAALKDADLPGMYDGLSGRSVKRGTGKLSFDIDARTNEAKGMRPKIGGVSSEKPTLGFEDRLNYQKAQSECKEAGIDFKTKQNFGVFFMVFADMATQQKAAKLVKRVIDKSEESSW